MPTKSCKTCGWRTLNPQQCSLIGYKYADNRHICCPYYVAELPICDHCGKPDPQLIITTTSSGKIKKFCNNCLSLSETCGGCLFSATCDFETNPSPIPKSVQKRIQQGNQIFVVTEKNEKRVEETCHKNCKCFNPEYGSCNRENNCCGNILPTIFNEDKGEQ